MCNQEIIAIGIVITAADKVFWLQQHKANIFQVSHATTLVLASMAKASQHKPFYMVVSMAMESSDQ